MIATGLAHAAMQHVSSMLELAPSPTPGGNGVNTDKVLGFFVKNIVPILLAALGVIFIGRAGKGEMSKVMTSSAIAIVGLLFIAGAGAFFFFGEYLVGLIFG